MTVATFADANLGDHHADMTATIHWGDNSSSAGTVSFSGSTYSVSSSRTYVDEGGFPVTVDITDDGGNTLTAIGKTTVMVADATLSDTITTATPSATEGASTGSLTVATFTDANPGDHHADMTATIHWGDNSTSTGTVAFSGGTYSVSGSRTYDDDGSFPVTVDIADDGGGTLIGIGKTIVMVADATLGDTSTAATSSATNGSTGSLTVARFTDANPGDHRADFTATIHWGDNSASTGTVAFSGGTYSVSGSRTYVNAGSFAVTVDITDDGGSTLTGIGKTRPSRSADSRSPPPKPRRLAVRWPHSPTPTRPVRQATSRPRSSGATQPSLPPARWPLRATARSPWRVATPTPKREQVSP